MSYTVVGGETLKTIARNVLGDSSLWWRIADANGLAVSGDGELTAGQTLSIPKLALNANNADTFQPYDPSRVTGSLDSVLPAPAGQGGGCGALGKIIMVAVAVAVTVFSGGFGSPVAAALGSIAGQMTGNLLGVQDGFSWKSVALSALSAGLANNLPLPDLGSAWQNAAVRMGTVNALTQGIGVVTGLQDRFDWKSVAASAAGGAVGSYVGEQLKGSTMFSDWNQTAAGIARGTISGFAAGTAAAVARGGRISIQQVATDAFGNALGSSLTSMSTGTELQAQTNKGLYSLGASGDGGTGLRLGSGEGLRYSDMRASSTWDEFGPSPVERLEASGPDVIAQAYKHMQAFPQTSARFQEVVDYYGSKAAYGNLPSLTPDAIRVGFNSRAGEVWSTDANTFPVAEQTHIQPTTLVPPSTGLAEQRSSQSLVDMIPTDGYSLVPSTQPERVGVMGRGLNLLERFERSPVGMMAQGLPPEGFILGVAKGGLNTLSRLERIGNAVNPISAEKTGTIWDVVKASGPNHPGSVIPRSFELGLENGQKIWIDGNATKHIAEYAAVKAENFSPEMVRLVSQEQIRSLSSAVTTAVDTGIQYRKMMHVDGWELIFAPPKSANQLPALYHALYKRK
jgi:hypothetical protein